MLKKQFIASLMFTAITSGVFASPSLMTIYEEAVANDPQLAISRLRAENAKEDVKSGFSNVLPSVSTGASYGVSSTRGEDNLFPDFDTQNIGASVTISQNIFVLAAITAYDALKVNASMEEINAVFAEQSLMIRVAESYITALRSKNALEVLKAQLEAVDRQYDQTNQRYEVGLVTITDVLDARATLDQTKVALIRAESQYDIALQNISTITGSTPDGVMSVSEDLPIEAPSAAGQKQWVDFAVTKHPEILAAKKGLEVGQLTLKAKQEQLLPSVSGQFGYSYSNDLNTDNEANWSASYGISLSYNLYDGGSADAGIVKQGISNNIAEHNVEILKRGKGVEVANFYRTVQADAQNVDAQKQALKSRNSALQATTVGYEVGTRNIVEVLNSQLAVFNAQNALSNARYDFILNTLKLKKAAGQLNINDLESIEDFLID